VTPRKLGSTVIVPFELLDRKTRFSARPAAAV
jgi:hypothetical protein